MPAATKADLVTSLATNGYTLKSDSSARGFDRQLFIKQSGLACTVTSTSAAHTIASANTNRLDTKSASKSIGSLDDVVNHLKAIYG